eukprot:454587_1
MCVIIGGQLFLQFTLPYMATTYTITGVTLALCGNIIQSCGFIAQKKGHNQINEANKDIPKMFQKSVLTRWIWWVGIAVYTIGATMNSISLNFAAQSVVSPLGAINLVTIALLSYFILKEPLRHKDIIAITVILVGILLVVIFGPTTATGGLTTNELRNYFQGVPYIITVSILIVITVIDCIAVIYVERKNLKSEDNEHITSGEYLLLFSYVWISCFFASNQTLFVKSAVSIALQANATDYLSYVVWIVVLICFFSMEYFRHKALAHFGTLYVIPTFAVSCIILTSVLGMVFFEEYESFTSLSAILYALGIVFTICGVLVLSFDIARAWSDMYDDIIKVALVRYDEAEYKHPKTVCIGGPTAEYLQNYFLKHNALCDGRENDPFANLEQWGTKSAPNDQRCYTGPSRDDDLTNLLRPQSGGSKMDLQQYHDVLFSAGFTDNGKLSELTQDTLKRIGIKKVFHRKELLKRANALPK